MNPSQSTEQQIQLTIDSHQVVVPPKVNIIQALWYAGYPRVKGVGCLEGVCGSCRIMVRRSGEMKISMELGCQTLVEEGMDVMFLDFPTPTRHEYRLDQIPSSWQVQKSFTRIFPEATSCRNCGGCNEACPRGIEVEKGVNLAAEGNFREAGGIFSNCIMCDLCMTGCPENIAPNHVGLFARRVNAYFHIRPSNLINRLGEIERGEHSIQFPSP